MTNVYIYYDENEDVMAVDAYGQRYSTVYDYSSFISIYMSVNTVLPNEGSPHHVELLSFLRASSIEREMTKALPSNDYSIIITRNAERLYTVSSPLRGRSVFQNSFVTVDEAYQYALSNKRNLVYTRPDEPWNIWPRKGTNAYKALIGQEVTPEKSKFKEMLGGLRNSFNAPYEQEFINAFYRYALRTTNYKNLNTALSKYIKSITGLDYVVALTGEDRFLTNPNNAVRLYIGQTKSDGYEYYTKAIARKYGKVCVTCKDWFNKSALKIHPRTSELACEECLSEQGYYKCGLNCAELHHESRGCDVYHQSSPDTIYNYSTDVLGVIHKMQQTPEDKPVNGVMLRYGVELEVFPKTNVPSRTAQYNCGKALMDVAMLKSDSSLRAGGMSGFEIVTIPATLEYHRKVLWKKFFNTVYSDDLTAAKSVRSWDTGCCGIHVHITRAALTEMQLSKMLVFYHEPYNATFLSRIAGRKVGPDAVYCKSAKKKLRAGVSEDCREHHDAITISRRNRGKTAEVRIFRGNATQHGIMRSLEFVDAVVKWCGQNSGRDVLDFRTFLEWFNNKEIKSQYPELRKHLIDLKYLKPKKLKDGGVIHPKATLDVVEPQLKTA